MPDERSPLVSDAGPTSDTPQARVSPSRRRGGSSAAADPEDDLLFAGALRASRPTGHDADPRVLAGQGLPAPLHPACPRGIGRRVWEVRQKDTVVVVCGNAQRW